MKILFNILKVIVGLILILLLVFYLGPKADFEPINPDLPELRVELSGLSGYIDQKNASISDIKEGNESRIVWADSVRQTEYAIVYLHGFSASPMEGAPLHAEIASRYGMNLYLPRLAEHGVSDEDAFLKLTPSSLINDAKEALVIGRKLGKKVIIMSCSTGSSLAFYLMANHSDIYGHIAYSPNIEIFDPTSKMLTGPWGKQIVKKVIGEYQTSTPNEDTPDSVQQKIDQYWSGKYRVEGLVALQSLLDMTMTDETFEAVTQPYFIGCYYKNDTAQDMTVSVDAMRRVHAQTSTSKDKKQMVFFAEAGAHVICSPLKSKEYEGVKAATIKYMEEVLGLEAPNGGVENSEIK